MVRERMSWVNSFFDLNNDGVNILLILFENLRFNIMDDNNRIERIEWVLFFFFLNNWFINDFFS